MTDALRLLSTDLASLLEAARAGVPLNDDDCLRLAECNDLAALMRCAAAIRDRGFGGLVTYSRKVFVPLTHQCRNHCGYCSFVRPAPSGGERAFMTSEEVLAVARAGQQAGCREALFTLGERPEVRHRVVCDELARLGHASTVDYICAMARLVLEETGLLPHVNAGTLKPLEIMALREVSASMGLMLESTADRLCRPGGPHAGSPDKRPARRLATIDSAGAARVPFTSGILVGIGETRRERIEALLALRSLHARHGHLQEVIVQNFRAHAGTPMADAAEPTLDEHLWTIAVARIVFGVDISIQAPPNLSAGSLERVLAAGIDDWGGISPVTEDYVNPSFHWPEIDLLARQTSEAGHLLVERLALHPRFVHEPERWLAPTLRHHVLAGVNADGYARDDGWAPGVATHACWPVSPAMPATIARREVALALTRLQRGAEPAEADLVTLFGARGDALREVCEAADDLRRQVCGDTVGYVVNRNITYTNLCRYRCGFCAFARGRRSTPGRDAAYDLPLEEIARRAREAWDRGATEVCIQGGIHPSHAGQHFLDMLKAVHSATPGIHVHAFSPLEVSYGARTLGLSVRDFLEALVDAGLGSLPGTAAEILDDDIRRRICPDKVSTAEWLSVVETAHAVGLRTTATIMFGHVERPVHWARHLLLIRRLQQRTGGFTEFVPLPFVAKEAPLFVKAGSRSGPTLREAVLMHAVARLALHPVISNIQASWVKMGPDGMRLCLDSGANDYGGTLIDESISRAAGAIHGCSMSPQAIERHIVVSGRTPRQRTTLYGDASAERQTVAARAWSPPLNAKPAFSTPTQSTVPLTR